MSDFMLYFNLGLEHIADIQAYDHMLFIVSLCAIFSVKEWKKVLVLVTAFTIGHSITLALSVTEVLTIDKDLIETLIPITIIVTCIINLLLVSRKDNKFPIFLHYGMALFFGLIHGMGFANYLKALLMGMGSIGLPLFSFNVGIEVGQIGIVGIYLAVISILISYVNIKAKHLTIAVSILCLGVAATLL